MRREERLDDAEEGLRIALDAQQARLWTAMPGIVDAVDLEAQTVSVQPAIRGQVTDAEGVVTEVDMPLLVDVPICWPRAGGFALTFPVAAGDEVLVVFASRCIDAWWQSGGVGSQAELRMHDLSDGFAILAPTSQPRVLGSVSEDSAQLRDEAGTTYLEITGDGKVQIVAAAAINLTAPAINLTGTLVQTGGTATLEGIQYGTHVHGGVQTGGSDTSGPSSP